MNKGIRNRLPILYFVAYAAIGSVLPFLSVYYRTVGLSGSEIGVFAAFNPLATISLVPIWGSLADRTGHHRAFLVVALAISIVAALSIGLAHTFLILCIGSLLFAGSSAAIIPLLDTITLHVLQMHENDYGLTRLWGSLGSGLFVLLIGVLSVKEGINVIFASYMLFATIGIIVTLFLSYTSLSLSLTASSMRQGIGVLFNNIPFRLLLVALIFLGVGMGAGEAFLGILIIDVGGTSFHIGLAFALQALVEIPMMGLTSRILYLMTPRRLFVGSFCALALLLTVAGFIPQLLVVLMIQPLWGLAWAGYWTGSTIEIAKLVPPSLQASAQTLASAATLGLGSMLGALLGGWFLQTVGSVHLYQIIAGTTFLGVLVFLLLESKARNVQERRHNIFVGEFVSK